MSSVFWYSENDYRQYLCYDIVNIKKYIEILRIDKQEEIS